MVGAAPALHTIIAASSSPSLTSTSPPLPKIWPRTASLSAPSSSSSSAHARAGAPGALPLLLPLRCLDAPRPQPLLLAGRPSTDADSAPNLRREDSAYAPNLRRQDSGAVGLDSRSFPRARFAHLPVSQHQRPGPTAPHHTHALSRTHELDRHRTKARAVATRNR